MPWGTPLLDGLSITTVTVPAGAVRVVLSNFRAPVGSAASVTVDVLPPPAAAVVVGGAAVAAAVVVLADELELPPHAASASTPAVARAAAARRGV